MFRLLSAFRQKDSLKAGRLTQFIQEELNLVVPQHQRPWTLDLGMVLRLGKGMDSIQEVL